MIYTQFHGRIAKIIEDEEGFSYRRILLFPMLKSRKMENGEFYGTEVATFCNVPRSLFKENIHCKGTLISVNGKINYISNSTQGEEQINETHKSITLPFTLSIEVYTLSVIRTGDRKNNEVVNNSSKKEEQAKEEQLNVDAFISYQ